MGVISEETDGHPAGEDVVWVRASRPAVVEAVRRLGLDAAVGRGEVDGVGLRVVTDAAIVTPAAAQLAGHLRTPVLQLWSSLRTPAVQWWSGDRTSPGDPSVAALVEAFAGSDVDPAAVHAVLDAAGDDPTALARALRLPEEFTGDAPMTGVVLARTRADLIRMTAAQVGRVWSADLGEGWSVLATEDPDEFPTLAGLAAGVTSSGGRRPVALVVWTTRVRECGYLVFQRGRLVDSHRWNWRWEWLGTGEPPEDMSADVGDAAVVAQAFGRAEDAPQLRALLRRSGPVEILVADLVRWLDTPGQVTDLLEDRRRVAELPGAVHHEQVGVWGSMRAEARRGSVGPRPRWLRDLELGQAVAGLVIAGILLVLSAGFVVQIATDGAFLDEPRATVGDWASLVLFTVLAVVSGGLGLRRLRRLRARRRAEAGGD